MGFEDFKQRLFNVILFFKAVSDLRVKVVALYWMSLHGRLAVCERARVPGAFAYTPRGPRSCLMAEAFYNYASPLRAPWCQLTAG